jgi:hypothetical protein
VDPGFGIGFVVLWILLNLLGKRKKSSSQTARPPASRPQQRLPVTLPRSTGADPTQREGARLQDLLRELGKTIDEAAGPRGRPASARLPPAEEVEERGSLETMPEARSLEEGVRRPERTVVDADDEAEAIVARRIAASEANARPLAAADHQVFDARVRQEPADATATGGYSMRRLRSAVVWREILGPPVSLREGDER